MEEIENILSSLSSEEKEKLKSTALSLIDKYIGDENRYLDSLSRASDFHESEMKKSKQDGLTPGDLVASKLKKNFWLSLIAKIVGVAVFKIPAELTPVITYPKYNKIRDEYNRDFGALTTVYDKTKLVVPYYIECIRQIKDNIMKSDSALINFFISSCDASYIIDTYGSTNFKIFKEFFKKNNCRIDEDKLDKIYGTENIISMVNSASNLYKKLFTSENVKVR